MFLQLTGSSKKKKENLFVCLFVCLWSGPGPLPLRPPPRAPHTDGVPELLRQLHPVQTVRSGRSGPSVRTQPCQFVRCDLVFVSSQMYNLSNELSAAEFTLLLPTDDAIRQHLSRTNSSLLVGPDDGACATLPVLHSD